MAVAIVSIDSRYWDRAGGETRRITVTDAGATAGTVQVQIPTLTARSCTVVSWSATLIVITTPNVGWSGDVDLIVTTQGGGSTDTLERYITTYAQGAMPTYVVEADAVPEVNAY